MEDWKTGFDIALLKFLQGTMSHPEAVEITGFSESTKEMGYCETCSYTTVVVEFSFKDKDGKSQWDEWEGSFASLIQDL